MKKHIADIESFHSLSKKPDVVTADRPHIQHVTALHPLKTFQEKGKSGTGIVGKMRLRLGMIRKALERGSQRSHHLIGSSSQDGRFLARI